MSTIIIPLWNVDLMWSGDVALTPVYNILCWQVGWERWREARLCTSMYWRFGCGCLDHSAGGWGNAGGVCTQKQHRTVYRSGRGCEGLGAAVIISPPSLVAVAWLVQSLFYVVFVNGCYLCCLIHLCCDQAGRGRGVNTETCVASFPFILSQPYSSRPSRLGYVLCIPLGV